MAGLARRAKVDGKWRIDKRNERGRTLDIHALRHTVGTLLSTGGVAPRTAQAAMRYLHDVMIGLQVLGSTAKSPSEADVFRELLALDAEFDDVECDFEADELCVTTPSVTLEGISLGRFQIQLNWSLRDNPLAYRVVALDANPAVSNNSVTHPHLSDEILCEGDGQRAIRAALDEGRLADFFLLVWRLLDTYSPGRAFVELSDWNGAACNECGTRMHEDDRCICCGCEEVYCPECMHFCSHCDQIYCVGCISRCQICDGSVCGSCRDACANCRAQICPDCVSDGKCHACRDTGEDDDADETDHPQTDGVSAIPESQVLEASRPIDKGACHV